MKNVTEWNQTYMTKERLKLHQQLQYLFTYEMTSILEVGRNFIQLNYDVSTTVETSPNRLSLQQRPIILELLVSVDLHKTGDNNEEPFLTGLVILNDGRMLAVDNNNKKCIILNERLQILGTPYNFKLHPHCVVCLSPDALCVTFGKSGVVCLLSVSTDNTIRLTREIKTPSNFDSIYCMSPSHLVVSTYEDPRHSRKISMAVVESDFDHVAFPKKTYQVDESKCTYVQSKNTLVLTDRFAHAVYMYYTMKGTSRVVSDENIQEPRSACVGPGYTVLVCRMQNHSIVRIPVDGDILGTYPVDMPGDMKGPTSICVSKDGTRLVVSNSALSYKNLHMNKISLVLD